MTAALLTATALGSTLLRIALRSILLLLRRRRGRIAIGRRGFGFGFRARCTLLTWLAGFTIRPRTLRVIAMFLVGLFVAPGIVAFAGRAAFLLRLRSGLRFRLGRGGLALVCYWLIVVEIVCQSSLTPWPVTAEKGTGSAP